jgi:hypothetical protein
MTLQLGLSDAGLLVPRMADFLEEIRDSYKADTGLDPDWDSDLVIGRFSAIMAQLLGQVSEGLQAVYDGFDPGAATGVQLSNLSAIVGVLRKRKTKGQVQLLLTGTPFTPIPQGRLAEGGGLDGRARWKLKANTTIEAGGTVLADFEAELAGRIEAEPGAITTMVTPVPGWTAVTNPAKATPGLDDEKDDQLRVRRQQSLQRGDGLGLGSLRAKVLDLDFILSASVIDNPDNETQVIEGIGIPGNSFVTIVSPDPLTSDQKAEMLRLIYKNTPLGIRSHGDESGVVTGSDGFEKTVKFSYREELVANIVVTLTMASGYSVADASPALKKLVSDHVATLLIGEPLYVLDIFALAAQVPGVTGLTVTINGLGVDLDPTALQQVVMGTWSP